jgi:hypothetical protein
MQEAPTQTHTEKRTGKCGDVNEQRCWKAVNEQRLAKFEK